MTVGAVVNDGTVVDYDTVWLRAYGRYEVRDITSSLN